MKSKVQTITAIMMMWLVASSYALCAFDKLGVQQPCQDGNLCGTVHPHCSPVYEDLYSSWDDGVSGQKHKKVTEVTMCLLSCYCDDTTFSTTKALRTTGNLTAWKYRIETDNFNCP